MDNTAKMFCFACHRQLTGTKYVNIRANGIDPAQLASRKSAARTSRALKASSLEKLIQTWFNVETAYEEAVRNRFDGRRFIEIQMEIFKIICERQEAERALVVADGDRVLVAHLSCLLRHTVEAARGPVTVAIN